MKAYGIIGIGIIVGAIPLIEYRPDRDGAETLIGISVVDDSGNVVPDARVYFKFLVIRVHLETRRSFANRRIRNCSFQMATRRSLAESTRAMRHSRCL